ncbi:hydrogenase expression/formation protein HypE [Deferribacterales bacterium RsTz2092]|nr:hydrogenase expression/formation protein HypE [Deferribacterales bacterium]
MNDSIISLSTGGGGRAMQRLIKDVLFKHFKGSELREMRDASYFMPTELIPNGELAISTDSFVVTPEIFPGGNLGKLAVAGTTNDLACAGAVPQYITCALVIPEGYRLDTIETIIATFAQAADEADVEIIAGDTKVIPAGELSGLIINTTGVGRLIKRTNDYASIKVGDRVIITSDIARHGIAISLARGEFGFEGIVESDCNILCKMLNNILGFDVHFIRDATRGGVAAVLNEIADKTGLGFVIDEKTIPLDDGVEGLCEALGFDPLDVANEGVALVVVGADDVASVLDMLHSFDVGTRATLCGEVVTNSNVVMTTRVGGRRYIDMPLGEILPRIC